jgi:hypothetical protein
VVVVQLLVAPAGSVITGREQSVFGAHASVGGLTGHCVESSEAHTMSAPQSASVAQVDGAQTNES